MDRYPRRIYALDPRTLSQEQIAVTFAMTSRRPEAFDEIAKVVSEEKAADFHEKWVLNYGHASVAEHAVLHMAVENISRLACDELEDNRLAAYTEKSSRYQVLDAGCYYVPPELVGSSLRQVYVLACDALFQAYQDMIPRTIACLKTQQPQREGERESAYQLRLRRVATDHCRFLLPAATLTNVGVTMNARSLEHALRKLFASPLQEVCEVAVELKEEGRKVTPTLVKYSTPSPYQFAARPMPSQKPGPAPTPHKGFGVARLLHYDSEAEAKVVAALIFKESHGSYDQAWKKAKSMSAQERSEKLESAWGDQGFDRELFPGEWGALGRHDMPSREAEIPFYTFEFLLDYGAYREFKRHRMQTYIAQPLTNKNGYVVPDLILDANLTDEFRTAIDVAERAYGRIAEKSPLIAQYVLTHSHLRRVLSHMNLRECYHLFKLRTSPDAHFTLRRVMQQAKEAVERVHPSLMKHFERVSRS